MIRKLSSIIINSEPQNMYNHKELLGGKKAFISNDCVLDGVSKCYSLWKKIFCLSLNLMRWNCFKLSIICVLVVIGAYLLIRTLNEYLLVMRSADMNDVICQVWVVKSSYMTPYWLLIWLHIEYSMINFLSISQFFLSPFQIKYYSHRKYLQRLLVLANLRLLIVFYAPIFYSQTNHAVLVLSPMVPNCLSDTRLVRKCHLVGKMEWNASLASICDCYLW